MDRKPESKTPTRDKPLPYGRHWIQPEDIEAVLEVLRGDWITQGPKIEEFEREVARYCVARYAVALSSGTAALHAACAVAGVSPGDEVVTTPLTFAATANAVVYCGGKPVFADIRPDTLNIDPAEIRRRLSNKTKAIMPVDFAGHPADLEEIRAIARERNLVTIEDAAHALGAEYKGRRIGTQSDMTILSFHPVKHITTGEGGMVLTESQDFYERLRAFRHHGILTDRSKLSRDDGPWYYEIQELGHNFRITDFQCALGLSQMKHLDSFLKRRREIAARYNQAFGEMEEIVTPFEAQEVRSAYHIYVIQLRLERLRAGRGEVFQALQAEGLGVRVHYPPVHLHPYYQRELGNRKGDYPWTEAYYERAITLPLFPRMSDQDVAYVIEAVKRAIERYKG